MKERILTVIIILNIFFGIFSFSSFISIFFIFSISIPFSIFTSSNHLKLLYSIVSIFNPSISFISISNPSTSSIFSLVIFVNFISSFILYGFPQNLSFITMNLKFLSNSSDSSIFLFNDDELLLWYG